MKSFLCLLFTLFSFSQIFSQYKIKDSCGAFSLHIIGKNLKYDTVSLVFSDCDSDKINVNHTVIFSNGHATVTGKINRATEGILWTDKKVKWFDAPNVIRFIIEPTNMTLSFTTDNDTAKNITISGSYAQKQKEDWEAVNASLMRATDNNENNLFESLRLRGKMDSTELKKKLDIIGKTRDSLKEERILTSLKYVKANPDSYFSGYLLYHFKRSLPTDTLETYYCYLDSSVMFSDFGKITLDDLLKQTNDWAFRKRFTDSATYQILKNIKSIYDISLTNQKGTKTSLSRFKGDLILIDFWGSWCGPCIQNVPYLKKLIAEMKNRPFKVISVSLDDSIGIWKKSTKKYGFPGIDLFDGNKLLSTYFKVLWVPRYIIINPDGTVANMDAPQANDPQLAVLINNLLNKNK
jgi:peroxiredoxin